ncbi:MAG: TetR/AcrR family transcriptional regulator [Desulfobacterales bacterium]|nr:TetR/AcrR family transcriptional regulator [Desulfobacterales bacterium]
MSRKQAIIKTATQLFAENGFFRTSTVDIAESAGVAHGTLFYHFKNKEGIIYEIFRLAGDTYVSELQAAVGRHRIGLEKIEAVLRFNTAFSRSHSKQLLIFLRDFPEELASKESRLKALVKSVGEQVIEIIEQCLETGIADGSVATSNIQNTAHILNGLTFGLMHMNLLSPLEIPELADSLQEFCRKALAPENDSVKPNQSK